MDKYNKLITKFWENHGLLNKPNLKEISKQDNNNYDTYAGYVICKLSAHAAFVKYIKIRQYALLARQGRLPKQR